MKHASSDDAALAATSSTLAERTSTTVQKQSHRKHASDNEPQLVISQQTHTESAHERRRARMQPRLRIQPRQAVLAQRRGALVPRLQLQPGDRKHRESDRTREKGVG